MLEPTERLVTESTEDRDASYVIRVHVNVKDCPEQTAARLCQMSIGWCEWLEQQRVTSNCLQHSLLDNHQTKTTIMLKLPAQARPTTGPA